MTGKKCEVCGREIENPTNRQRFCKECAKKRQAEAFHRYYLANREYYAERSKEQSTRRKQSRLEELLAGEPRPFKPPKYTIETGKQPGYRPRHQLRLVFVSAFGRKSLYGMKGERLYDADYEVRRIDGRFCPAGC